MPEPNYIGFRYDIPNGLRASPCDNQGMGVKLDYLLFPGTRKTIKPVLSQIKYRLNDRPMVRFAEETNLFQFNAHEKLQSKLLPLHASGYPRLSEIGRFDFVIQLDLHVNVHDILTENGPPQVLPVLFERRYSQLDFQLNICFLCNRHLYFSLGKSQNYCCIQQVSMRGKQMDGKKALWFGMKGLSYTSIGAIFYTLFCMRGF